MVTTRAPTLNHSVGVNSLVKPRKVRQGATKKNIEVKELVADTRTEEEKNIKCCDLLRKYELKSTCMKAPAQLYLEESIVSMYSRY